MQILEVIKDKSERSFTTSRYDLLGLSDKAAGQGSDLCCYVCSYATIRALCCPAHAELQTVSKHTICNIYFHVPQQCLFVFNWAFNFKHNSDLKKKIISTVHSAHKLRYVTHVLVEFGKIFMSVVKICKIKDSPSLVYLWDLWQLLVW